MIRVHLYGKLRRFAEERDARSDSVTSLQWRNDTVASVIERIGIPCSEVGSNLFVNGRYATLETRVADGDRLGIFPDDMQLLYKWYFAPSSGSGTSESGSKGPEK